MAEGNGVIYNEFKKRLLAGEVDLDADTIKLALVAAYTPNIDTDNDWTDVSAKEVSGTGYTAGGATVGGKTVTEDTVNDRGKFDGTDVTWPGLNSGTPSHAVMYDDTHATKALIAYWEVTTVPNGADYTVAFGANGVLYLG